MSNPAVRRIKGDIRELAQNPTREYHAAPLEDNLFEWHFTVRGPRGSDFQGGIYHGRISLPHDYPFKPPKLKFQTKIYHCNIDAKGGICLDILKSNWSPALTISKGDYMSRSLQEYIVI